MRVGRRYVCGFDKLVSPDKCSFHDSWPYCVVRPRERSTNVFIIIVIFRFSRAIISKGRRVILAL